MSQYLEFLRYANNPDPVQVPQNAAPDESQHFLRDGISMQNIYKKNETVTRTPKNRNGLIQMIRLDKSTGQKRVELIKFTLFTGFGLTVNTAMRDD